MAASIVSQTRTKVRKMLREIYGKTYKDIVQEIDDVFIVRRGSAAVHVSVKPLSKTDALVQAMAYVVQGAKIGPKVLNYLMRQNATAPIGAYGLLFDDTITYSHTITGSNLDVNELRTTVATVAFVADETDDEIRKMAGGMRAVDANASLVDHAVAAPIRKKAPAKKTPAKKTVAKKAPAKKPAAKKAPARKRTKK